MGTHWASTLLLFLVALPGLRAAVTLVESGGGLQAPGGSLRLLCKGSGFSLVNSNVGWTRQPIGKSLEYVAGLDQDGGATYAPALKGRSGVFRDEEKGGVRLEIHRLGEGDAATYYCARARGHGSPRAPDLFPLVSCTSGDSTTPSTYTVGCMAMDFTPAELQLSWSDDEAGADVITGAPVRLFPVVGTGGGRHMASSSLSFPTQEGKSRQPFYCRARHAQGQPKMVAVSNPGSRPVPAPLSLHPPSREEFEGPYRNSTLLCRAGGAGRPLRWFRNGADVTRDALTRSLAPGGVTVAGGTFTESRLVVTEAEWDAGTTFSCQLEAETRNTSKGVECGYMAAVGEQPIKVKATPPPFSSIFATKSARLTCVVTNLPSVEGLSIAWRDESGRALDTRPSDPVIQSNNLFKVEGVATVRADQWDKGGLYTCKVTHPELLFPLEDTTQKTNARDARAPSVYIFPPPAGQLAAQEAATVTCLVKGFNPPDLFVQWLRNDEPLPEADYVTAPPLREARSSLTYFTYSSLTVSEADWSAGNVFTCLVGHERIPLQLTQKSVDKTAGKATALNVSLVLSDLANACY